MRLKLLAIIFIAVAFFAFPVYAKSVTAGDFALKYARALNIKVNNTTDAMRALAARGLLSLTLKSDSLLTEQDLADIFKRAGKDATTSNPTRSVDENAANAALSGLTMTSSPSSQSDGKEKPMGEDSDTNNGKKTRPKGQEPSSRANPNADP